MNELDKNFYICPPFRLSKKRPVYSHIIEYETVYLHQHDYIEFFYVFNGSCRHRINGEITTISTGDAYFMVPTDAHQFSEPTNSHFLHRDILISLDYFKECCAFFEPSLYENLLSGKYHLQLMLSIEQMSRIESFIPMLNDPLDDSHYDITAKALTCLIITFILEHNLQKNYNYPTWLTRLLSMLNAHDNLSVELAQILSHFAYSKEYLRRSFKKYIGVTMTDYFNKQKMTYALSLLQNTTYSVEQICESIGITNVAYFYQLFKKHFHVTPHSVRAIKN